VNLVVVHNFAISKDHLFEQIYNFLKSDPHYKRYNEEPNFEDLFHCLELFRSLKSNKKLAAPEFVDYYENFFEITPKNSFSKIYNAISYSDLDIHVLNFIRSLKESIFYYDCKAPTFFYTNFFKTISKSFDEVNIFTLNYDCWFDKVFERGEFTDGFVSCGEDYSEFNPNKLLNSEERVKINYLHGNIYLQDKFDYMIEKNAFDTKEWSEVVIKRNTLPQRESTNEKKTQSREMVEICPLVVGKLKLEKTVISPLDIYKYNLYKSLFDNDLLIIGYGFGDDYLNSILSNYRNLNQLSSAKACVITYKDLDNTVPDDLFYPKECNVLNKIFEKNYVQKVTEDMSLIRDGKCKLDNYLHIMNGFNKDTSVSDIVDFFVKDQK